MFCRQFVEGPIATAIMLSRQFGGLMIRMKDQGSL